MFLEEIDRTTFKIDKGAGYMYTYMPDHLLANRAGKVYEHIYIAVLNAQRLLSPDEVVHHKDRNKCNNDWENLIIMTRSTHTALHQLEDGSPVEEISCKYCGEIFTTRLKRKPKVCSRECAVASKSKFEIEPDTLFELVWKYPTVKVAEMFSVSDVAIGKRCKKFGILKPPRGYWAKQGHHSNFGR